jgi:hypothetical protein
MNLDQKRNLCGLDFTDQGPFLFSKPFYEIFKGLPILLRDYYFFEIFGALVTLWIIKITVFIRNFFPFGEVLVAIIGRFAAKVFHRQPGNCFL